MKLAFGILLLSAAAFAIPAPGGEVDCSAVLCLLPTCPTGFTPQTSPGECCPTCRKLDCSAVQCISPNCNFNEKIVTPPGECCPECELAIDCSAVICISPNCNFNEMIVTPPGECCPVCVLADIAPSPPTMECPQECTPEFCASNPHAMCTNPGPRELPGCTGSCNLSYCSACFLGTSLPPVRPACRRRECSDLNDYRSDTDCFRHWAKCAGKALKTNKKDDAKAFLCYSPPCPFKG